jgi:hypothetical protein
MAGNLLRRLLLFVTAALALLWLIPAAHACPFCATAGKTLTQEIDEASMVLFGHAENVNAGDNGGEGSAELVVEAVIKAHEILGNQTRIKLAKRLEASSKVKYLVFFDVFQGKMDPYRGMALSPKSDLPKYLEGALKVRGKDTATRLRFFFDYLDSEDSDVNADAYKEFGFADYKDAKDVYKDLPADKIAAWIKSGSQPYRNGLYASMLGHCGKEEHAKLLLEMLEDPKKRGGAGIDGVLAGYTLLKPREGWQFTEKLMGDANQEFATRYASLRAVRFFWDYRPDVVGQKEMVGGLCQLIEQSDIADLAIEDLRLRKRWEVADKVLALAAKPAHNDVPIVRRSILRYALCCPNNSQAAAYVEEFKKKDPAVFKEVEALLKLENPPPVAGK